MPRADEPEGVRVSARRPKGVNKAEFRPFDLSGGKALFKKGQKLQYNSVTQGTWVDAEVILVREDGAVMIDLKDGHWLSVADQKEKFRACERRRWDAGSEVQYFSVTQGGWTDCSIIEMREDGAVRISIKESYWMPASEQVEKLRLPCFDKSDEAIWQAERLLAQKPPDCQGAEEKYREVLDEEPDSVSAMHGLAALVRDYHGDLRHAEKLFRAILDESPYDIVSLSDLGDLLKASGKLEESKQMHQRWKRVRERLKDLEEEAF